MKLNLKAYCEIAHVRIPTKNEMSGWKIEPITIRQKQMLEKAGICYGDLKYKGQAYTIIHSLNNRKKSGLITPKQINILIRNGCNPKRIAEISERWAERKIRAL